MHDMTAETEGVPLVAVPPVLHAIHPASRVGRVPSTTPSPPFPGPTITGGGGLSLASAASSLPVIVSGAGSGRASVPAALASAPTSAVGRGSVQASGGMAGASGGSSASGSSAGGSVGSGGAAGVVAVGDSGTFAAGLGDPTEEELGLALIYAAEEEGLGDGWAVVHPGGQVTSTTPHGAA
jgi:hypothetical protein